MSVPILTVVEIIDFTDEELIQAGFMGDGESLGQAYTRSKYDPSHIIPLSGAPESVKDAVRQIKKDPEHLGCKSLSFFSGLSPCDFMSSYRRLCA